MAIKTTKDGRTIRTGKDYTAFRHDMWATGGGACWECGHPTGLQYPPSYSNSFHVHHKRGRGGGKRTDTFLACQGLCGDCHRRKHA